MTRPEAELTLAEETARRLILAGITWNHPQLRAIREWNAAARNRHAAAKEDT